MVLDLMRYILTIALLFLFIVCNGEDESCRCFRDDQEWSCLSKDLTEPAQESKDQEVDLGKYPAEEGGSCEDDSYKPLFAKLKYSLSL